MLYFPHPNLTTSEGILAIGGDLSMERLLLAYRWGIFPWYNNDEPILWWHPNPRFVLYPDNLKISKSMRPYFNKAKFTISYNTHFEHVIDSCQKINRKGQDDTWITSDMKTAYINLHKKGYAHSVEVWEKDRFVGGLYGISIGKIFYGESMFSLVPNASKFGFISLVQMLNKNQFVLIDCQQETRLLKSLGAGFITREKFMTHLRKNMLQKDDLLIIKTKDISNGKSSVNFKL